jgi:hypothetical protein
MTRTIASDSSMIFIEMVIKVNHLRCLAQQATWGPLKGHEIEA